MTNVGSASERFNARIVARRDAGGGLSWVVLLPSPKGAATYRVPGQYVEVRIDAHQASGFFALAGPEGAGQWDLLLRPNGGASEALLHVPIGGHVGVSAALGAGFPFEDAFDKSLAIVVTAGALGPALPGIERRLREGLGDRTTLLVGTHSLAGVPAMSQLDALRERGAKVRIVLSNEVVLPHDRGYVQHQLDAVNPEYVFVAGLAAMVDAVKEWGHRSGVSVRSNH
ncbi:hypothetical protein BH09MYX1_BH09MYX1_05010 [soil metagenome]